jgi:molecular chaperone DnaK
VAVYDLGGGTFDITLLEINEGVFQVLSTNGDSYLGGEDFDTRIVDWIVDGFKAEAGTDVREDKLALQRIKEAAERAKRELSFTTQTDINLPFISSDQSSSKHIRRTLSRRELEDMTSDLVERTIPLIEQALADAGLGLDRIDEIVLVGGQTRMPLVRKRITEFFGKPAAEGINPDEIVACGAAVQSGNLQDGVRDLIVLLDVTPFSLGIETERDTFEVIIDRNSTIPIRKTKAFTTVEHNQRRVKIHVLQGEDRLASLNKSLAVFELVGIEPAPAGVPQIDVTFQIDADGLVKVTAKDSETGLQQRIQVMPSGGLLSSEVEEIIRMDEERRLKAGVRG